MILTTKDLPTLRKEISAKKNELQQIFVRINELQSQLEPLYEKRALLQSELSQLRQSEDSLVNEINAQSRVKRKVRKVTKIKIGNVEVGKLSRSELKALIDSLKLAMNQNQAL